MKKHLILFMAALSLMAISCKKDEQADGYMNATVNAQSYKSIRINAHFPASSNGGVLSISSSAEGSRNMSLAINNYEGVGTYDFKPDELGKKNVATYTTYTQGDFADKIYTTHPEDNEDGYITISKQEGNAVEGRFKFKALYSPNPDKKEYVTVEGSFSTFL